MEELKHFGFDNYECKIIGSLLYQALTLKELSKKTQVPFGKIYSIVKKLKKDNIIQESKTRPKKVYIENAGKLFSDLINKKSESDRILFNSLRSFATDADKVKENPSEFFDIGTTQVDNLRIQSRTFTEATDEVCQILNHYHKPKSNRLNKTVWEKEIVEATKRGVVFRSIYPMGSELPPILNKLNKDNPEKFQVRYNTTSFQRLDIIDDKKVLIKLVSADLMQFGGVIFIEDEKFAENLKKIFNHLWDSCGE